MLDVVSFNVTFLKYISSYIESVELDAFISSLENLSKSQRVVKFGLFYKELSGCNVNINPYMIGFRNKIILPFLKMYAASNRNVNLYRINYDDIEFSILDSSDSDKSTFCATDFIDGITFDKVDKVIVLNKKDGVYYVKANKLVDIKYTSGWIDIPIYYQITNAIIQYIIKGNSLQELNDTLKEIIEYADNTEFFGYEQDSLSSAYTTFDHVPLYIKYGFVAKVMSKFAMLIKVM